MALATITLTIQDAKGYNGRLSLTVNYPQPIAESRNDPVQFAEQLARYLDPLIEGVIVNIGVSLSVTLPVELSVAPSPASDVEAGAKFQWRTVNGYQTRFRVPTWRETLILPGGVVDITDADVATLVNFVIDPASDAGNWNVGPADARGDDILTLLSAKEDFQDSRQ